ncbi:MAG: hypothetical protein JW702_05585 [Clostridiales bacterium]|nr:hypothetical protein [Clostridiales bacterium]
MNKKNNFHRTWKNASIAGKHINRVLVSISLITVIVVVLLSQSSMGSPSSSAPQIALSADPLFALDATYAYVGEGLRNDTSEETGRSLAPISQYPSAVYFNITRPAIENLECDAVLEVFNVTLKSDKGSIETFVFFTGTNYNPSFSDSNLNTLTDGIYDLFDLNAVDGITGNFCFNWTVNEEILSPKIGSFGTYTNYKNGLGLWSAGEPNKISITLHRIGCVTITNGAVSVQADSNGINNKKQVQLQHYSDGFLKNELVSMNQITETNRFKPWD